MIQEVKEYIRAKQLLNSQETIIVGLSGGADSVALLDILLQLGYKCIAAHCNFHLRGEESNRDAAFVKDICDKWQIKLHTVNFDTEAYAASKSISIEMAARELRYTWFEELRKSEKAKSIAIAHHQDDSVETILLNLIRGTGIRGLTGISAKNGFVVRPLLCITRGQIIEYLQERNISFVEDCTNKEDIYTRNKIRLKILPLLETINPSVKASINRTAEHLLQVENIYNTYINEAKKAVLNENRIDIQHLIQYNEPEAVLFEILSSYNFNSATIEQIFESINSQSGKIFYSDSYKVVKDRGFLLIDKLNEEDTPNTIEIKETDSLLSYPINIQITRLDKSSFKLERNSNILYLDCDMIKFPLTLRKWIQGDWFIPFGMKGKKKISDYFSDNKFSLIDKENTWLLCNGEDILWIVGHRSDERYRIKESTQNILQISLL